MTRKIDFLSVGPQRTGSTWFYEVFLHHPEICWPQGVKETFFFDTRFKKGFNWYYWHFRDQQENQLLGEVGPTYFDDPEAALRIHSHCPECKIIIHIRNPLEKTYSVFRHYYTLGEVPRDFDLAIQQRPRIIDCGRYQQHCERWERLFGAENVQYLVHDDIRTKPELCTKTISSFLGIEEVEIGDSQRVVNPGGTPFSPGLIRIMEFIARRLRAARLHHVVNWGKSLGLRKLYSGGKQLPRLTNEQKKHLAKEFAGDIKWLETKLGRSFSKWTAETK